MKIFLSGPMSNVPNSNRPEFSRVAGLLADMGHAAWVPPFEVSPTLSYREALGRCLAYLCEEAEGLVSLHGWWNSPGARAEAATASAIRIPMWHEERPGVFLPTVHAGNPANGPLLRRTGQARPMFAREGWASGAP